MKQGNRTGKNIKIRKVAGIDALYSNEYNEEK